jgi:hypothetical protein
MINHIEKVKNCIVAGKCRISEVIVQMWKENAEKFINANSSQQYVSGCRHGYIQELEQETVECVCV